MAFIQEDANPELAERALCLRKGIHWAPLSHDRHPWVDERGTNAWVDIGHAVPVRRCWERFAELFGARFSTHNASVAFHCCAYFAITAEHVRRYPLSTYQKLYEARNRLPCKLK